MDVITWTNELRLVVALALGLLIGLERESNKTEHGRLYLGGVRTFPIVSMLGYGCALLFKQGMALLLPVALIAVSALTVVAYVSKVKEGRPGATSEISMILTFVVGALALLADVWISMAVGILTALLLSEKAEIETQVERLDRVGFLATIRFLLITVIILPVLPDQDYTRFHLNPAQIWRIVIMVSAIGYVGYLLSRRFGKKIGLWLSGLLGGIVSSTAVSVSAGRLARRNPTRALEALQATIFASIMMYVRIIVLIWILNPSLLPALWWKMLILALAGAAISRTVNAHDGTQIPESETPELHNPFEIRPAVVFAILFVGLSILTSLIAKSFGNVGTLILSVIVGIGDIDPYILSIIQGIDVDAGVVVSAIILAMMSNTIIKGIYFGVLASSVRKATMLRFGAWALLHLPLAFI